MEDIRIDETVEGRIKIDFSHKYLKSKGVTMHMLIMDMDVSRNLVCEILLEVGYTEREIEESSFVIDAKMGVSGITFKVYTPHTLTHHPYILNGEKYEVPTEPVGFVVYPDDFLGGICECSGCNHVRKLFQTMKIAPYNSNVPKTGEDFEFGVFEYDEDEDEEDFEEYENNEDNEKLTEYFDDIQITPKTTTMRPFSSIDSEERNVDFDIHEELIHSQSSLQAMKDVRPYKPGHLIFLFKEIDEVLMVAKVLAEVLDEVVSLYSYDNRYFIVYDMDNFGQKAFRDDIAKDISAINIEHGGVRSKITKYYLAEYGKEVIGTNAFSTLLYYFK